MRGSFLHGTESGTAAVSDRAYSSRKCQALAKLRGKERARFKEMLENLLSAVPDTLTVDEVAELTGYHRRTILRYVQRKYIYAVNIMGKYYI